jgi:CHAT domain-containing protein
MKRSGVRAIAAVVAIATLGLAAAPMLFAQAEERSPRRVALLVGINEYQKRGFPTLRWAEDDVDELARELSRIGFDRVVVLKGSASGPLRPTKGNIAAQLDRLLADITKNDIVLVVLCGHGLQLRVKGDDGTARDDNFYCPINAVLNDPATMLSLSDLTDKTLHERGGRNLVLVDACRSAVADTARGVRYRGIQGRVVSLPEDTAILFSCRAGQESAERDDLKHGLFTYSVLEAIRATKGSAGLLTWAALVDRVQNRVAELNTDQEPIAAGAVGRLVLGRWQAESESPGKTFMAMERGRACSLLDQIDLTGGDLSNGRTVGQRNQFHERKAALKLRIADLEDRVGDPRDREGKDRFKSELAKARSALYDLYRDEWGSSPAYRNLITHGTEPVRLDQIQSRLARRALMLAYSFDEDGGYVLCVETDRARLVGLNVPAAEATLLGTDPGLLTARRLRQALLGEKGSGVLSRWANSKQAESLTPQLAALCRVLIPEVELQALLGDKINRLFIVSNGLLAVLPFEALVVEQKDKPKYLLDIGASIAYAPSATVLFNLIERTVQVRGSVREPVLAVGDPAYPAPAGLPPTRSTSTLTRLPYTGFEARWVAQAYSDRGIKATTLLQSNATERAVRDAVPGRRTLHFACHAVESVFQGKFFGALALTPGAGAAGDPNDDGFLTLSDIYDLNLKGCELTILSASSGYYSDDRGQPMAEGAWALSRGFLMAGSRRCVGGSLLLDDEATASLVGVFCSELAEAEKVGKPVDHAAALQAAKRWVQHQDKFKSPYYWASMVLIGPP